MDLTTDQKIEKNKAIALKSIAEQLKNFNGLLRDYFYFIKRYGS